MVTAKAWLTIRAKRSAWDKYPSGHPLHPEYKIENARVKTVTTNKPNGLDAEDIAFEIDIDIPDAWFIQPAPKVSVTFPEPPDNANSGISVVTDHVTKGRQPSAAASIIQAARNP